MNLATEIEIEKLALLTGLDSTFESITIKSLPDLVEGIDSILQDHLRGALVRHAAHLFEADRIDEKLKCFHVGETRLELEVLPSGRKENSLLIRLIPRGLSLEPSQMKLRKAADVKIDGPGKYSSVVYDIPTLCPVSDTGLLTTLTRDVFMVGHNWMNDKTMRCVRAASNDAHRSLYEYMRTVVTDPQLMNGFVFSALVQEKDFVVLDEEAARTAISLAASNAWKLGRSPAGIAVQALTQVVNSDDSVIIDAVKNEKTMDIDLTRDKYYQSDNSFTESLRAIWGSTMSCFPIMRKGKMLLVAFFRTEFKAQLEPVLIVHRARLEGIAGKTIGCMKKTLKGMMQVSRSGWAAPFGDFAGAFTAALLKSLQHH